MWRGWQIVLRANVAFKTHVQGLTVRQDHVEDIFGHEETYHTIIESPVQKKKENTGDSFVCRTCRQVDEEEQFKRNHIKWFLKETLPRVGGMKERRGEHPHGKEKLITKETRCDRQTEAKTEICHKCEIIFAYFFNIVQLNDWRQRRHIHISSLRSLAQQLDAPLLPGRQ